MTLKSITANQLSFVPNQDFVNQANINLQKFNELNKKAQDNYELYWAELAREKIDWHKPFNSVLNQKKAPFFTWFEDGQLSISYNCLDRHVKNNPNKIALIFESDNGQTIKVTYKELLSKVSQFANALKAINVKKGDRVILYLPHSIEAIVAMHASARIGAIHSTVFGGFSSKALADRILDANANVLITADGQHRGGKAMSLKTEVDAAIELLGDKNPIKHVIVDKRINDGKCNFVALRDIWWDDFIANKPTECTPEFMNSEDPLFILYTSGSTGTPKGVQHSIGGYLLGGILSMEWVFDYKDNDIYWCTADVGWITGHTYVCYGPLAVGATQIIFEGVPSYPTYSRFWEIIEKNKVTTFYTAPTAIRALIKAGADLPKNHNLSSLRLLGSVGEPINPEAWKWFYEVVGGSRCPIVDTWWQTETGSNMLSPLPGVQPLKPGSCVAALPGIMAAIIDESGNILDKNNTGYLVITKPFPSQLRTIWNNPDRFISSYFPEEIGHGKYYVAGDSAYLDNDGYFWILGRIDDVLNVSGHRLSTMEIESCLASHPKVAEAAVVGRPHEIKGESVFAFVVTKGGVRPTGEQANSLEKELRDWVGKQIGPIAKPDEIRFGDNLPKTRSGKIMRRLLRSIAKGEEIIQDVSTLENPSILEHLKNKI